MAETPGNSLARRIGDEIALLRDFVAILRQEQHALSGDDAEAIATATHAKTILAQRLGQLATERNLALAREGYAADRAGIDGFIARQVEAGSLPQLRDRLLTIAAEANELNRVNGEVIRLRMSHNQSSLNFLLGAGDGSSTYGRDGRSNIPGAATGRHLYTA